MEVHLATSIPNTSYIPLHSTTTLQHAAKIQLKKGTMKLDLNRPIMNCGYYNKHGFNNTLEKFSGSIYQLHY